MDKQAIFTAILDQLRAELKRRQAAAKDAASGATDAEARSESKYDTRATESSYLARGQAMQVEELLDTIRILEEFDLPESTSVVRPGALAEVELGGELMAFLLLPRGGGTEIVIDGVEVTVVTPSSPLGERIQGKFSGDRFSPREGGIEGVVKAVS